MLTTNRKLLLLVTAFAEGATGLCLLVLPAVLLAVLLGVEQPSVDALFVGRIAGTALLAIGVASWMARNDTRSPAQRGLLAGILIYNAVVALLLAYAGAALTMNGILLWPTAALHAILAAWCLGCLWPDRRAGEHP
jgi:Kef-type K+ transport system membrane component KefB